MKLSDEQSKIIELLLEWIEKNCIQNKDELWQEESAPYITLGGYAGTGKTTLITILRSQIKDKFPKLKISYCAYTGKATLVLKNKLIESDAIYSTDTISTIHGLIYTPIEDEKERIIGWKPKNELDTDLILVDEASMIDETIWKDLTGYSIPIIAIGDHGQLPPINGDFNLMQKPQLLLNEIYRQAKDNPIIKLSVQARLTGQIMPGKYNDTVIKVKNKEEMSYEIYEKVINGFDLSTLVICGYNNTRIKLNKAIRNALGIESIEPVKGDRVICLRNNHEKGIYNGMIGIIEEIYSESETRYFARINLEDEVEYTGLILKKQFNNPESLNFTDKRIITLDTDLFDFGYAITVHKSQGSQAKRVLFIEEKFSKMNPENRRRWIYTAITRAQQELYIIES